MTTAISQTLPKGARSGPSPLLRPLATAVLAVALAGCVSTRGLQPQATLAAPERLQVSNTLAGATLTPAAWPQTDWWKSLGDAQLDALVSQALAGNPSIAAVDARVRMAQAQAGEQDAARKAKIGAQAQYSGLAIPSTLAPPPFGGHYLAAHIWTLGGSYSPDLWGGHRATWEAAVDQAHAAQIDAQSARLTLAAGIVQVYAELAHTADLQALTKQEVERADAVRALTGQRVKAGIDNDFQLRQADAAVALAQRSIATVREQDAQLRAQLAALLGQGPDRGLAIVAPASLPIAPLGVPDDLPSGLLARRPDIVAARWRVEAAARGIAAMKAQFYPNINLSVSAGLASNSLTTLFEAPARFAQLGPSLSLPIFDGGRLRSGLAQRDAAFDAAIAQYDQTLVDAMHEVAAQVIAVRGIDAQLASQQQARDAARAGYELATQRYRGGLAGRLDVLAVQQSLLRAEQQIADLRAQRFAASVQLAQALGGGFHADGELSPPNATPDTTLPRKPFFAPAEPAPAH
ncbi:MAG: efflux transporter outer membrane subunit [Proteobacteria bacterium]|nr:efflux transporter outer membrane subunit [Pseudomonadota bacterium]